MPSARCRANFTNFTTSDWVSPSPFPPYTAQARATFLDAAFEHIDFSEFENEDEDIIRVALIGKPNVGKSSLTNCLLGENRMIVSDIPGTTRDAVDVQIENEHGRFCLIDTAGIRKKKKVDETIERYSVLRSFAAVDRADVCVIMLDANEGVTVQDTKIAGFANDKGKALVIAVNKWDIAQKGDGNDGKAEKRISTATCHLWILHRLCSYRQKQVSAQTG